jgi:hypothetical protein
MMRHVEPQPIPVGQEPPPLRPSSNGNGDHQGTTGRPPARHQDKPKRKGARRKTGDRFAVVNGFLDFTAGRLSRGEALTWLLLWRDTKPDGTARTSIADLARRIGADPSTAKRAVKVLTKAGLLAVVYRGSLRRGPSLYRVHPFARERAAPTNERTNEPPGR